MVKESENPENKIFIVFMVILLVIIILYLIIALHDHKTGPMGPPGPVTTIPTIVLPVPADTATNALFDYKVPVNIIVPISDYPIISVGLPLASACIIKIEIYDYNTGIQDLTTYMYTLHYTNTGGSYHRVRTVVKTTEVPVQDSNWVLVADPADVFVP
jgi:hypothetical protein